ncbi:MAG TPA: tail fiber domain-containing protein, partial [Alphaproteobacteria bacterium]|nr:tail fiber domain-containing protein [Alphaproteobacteria bacterium]
MRFTGTVGDVNYATFTSAAASGFPRLGVAGSDTNIPLQLVSKGNESVYIRTNGGTSDTTQFAILHTASANRWPTVTGSNGAAPQISTSAGNLTIAPAGGGTSITGTLGLSSDFAVNTNKFTVTGSSGDTASAGTIQGLKLSATGSVSSDRAINVTSTLSNSGATFGTYANNTYQSNVTAAYDFYSLPTTQATSFTLGTLAHFYAAQPTFGSGSSVTNQYGYIAESTLTGATNNFGFYSDIASSSNRWNFYANGTANNLFRGNVRIGSTVAPAVALDVTGHGHFQPGGATDTGEQFMVSADAGSTFLMGWNNLNTGSSSQTVARITRNGTTVGSISNTNVATAYNTSSDRRIKENIRALVLEADFFDRLQPVTYDFKRNYSKVGMLDEPSHGVGFVAQDLYGVIPLAVTPGDTDDDKQYGDQG